MEPSCHSIDVVYHFPCFDGLYSCLALHLYYSSFGVAAIRFYPYRTNKPFTQTLLPADIVYFLDCIGTKEMMQMALGCSSTVIVLDHHYRVEDIIASWSSDGWQADPQIDLSRVDTSRCACKLTWRYFEERKGGPLTGSDQKDITIRKVLDYVEDRDLFLNRLKDSRKVSSGFRDM